MTHTPPPLRGSYRTDQRAREAYSEGAGIFRIVPSAVACPRDADDVQALVRWAAQAGRPLVPRGAGSAMGGGNVGSGIVVDLAGLAKPPALDVAARTVTVGAGVALGLVEDLAARSGLRLPPDPSSVRWATAGGAFATNAAGPRSLRFGAMRRWVEGATVVTGTGEVVRLARDQGRAAGEAAGSAPGEATGARKFQRDVVPALEAAAPLITRRFPHTAKNSSGLALDAWLASRDLLDLFIGSEGILGIATEVVLRVDPVPAGSASLSVILPDLTRLGAAVQVLVATGPSTCELLDQTFLDLVRSAGRHDIPACEGLLLVEYEGDSPAALASQAARTRDLLRNIGLDAMIADTPESAAELWDVRHAASPILAALPPETRSLQVVEDGCVPIERLAEYVMLLRNAARSRGLRIVLFGHAGSGHLHANLLVDVTRPGFERTLAEILAEVSDGVARLGGTLAGEHGDGRLRAPMLERTYGPEILSLFRRVKDCFDPKGILNPGVILPTRGAPTALGPLKVGGAAPPIAPDLAAALRDLERNAGYATPRLALAEHPRPA